MKKLMEKVSLTLPDGAEVSAMAPMILSASRSTDIPAFHADWFMQRVRAGFATWKNPFNQAVNHVSFQNVRAIVFWTKDPSALLPHLDALDAHRFSPAHDRGPAYYFQYTLNDYERERLEPGVPAMECRIETFQRLSDRIGPDRVIWRYDPILLTARLNVDAHLERIERIGERLAPYTRKLVFSFVDVRAYQKVQRNLAKHSDVFREGLEDVEPRKDQQEALVAGLSGLRDLWSTRSPHFTLATCAEEADFARWGVEHNLCVDDALLAHIAPDDALLLDALGRGPSTRKPVAIQPSLFDAPPSGSPVNQAERPNLKDKGQRKACGCIISKDIGAYNTCGHLCAYCYANTSDDLVRRNLARRDPSDTGILPEGAGATQ